MFSYFVYIAFSYLWICDECCLLRWNVVCTFFALIKGLSLSNSLRAIFLIFLCHFYLLFQKSLYFLIAEVLFWLVLCCSYNSNDPIRHLDPIAQLRITSQYFLISEFQETNFQSLCVHCAIVLGQANFIALSTKVEIPWSHFPEDVP